MVKNQVSFSSWEEIRDAANQADIRRTQTVEGKTRAGTDAKSGAPEIETTLIS
jgi:hypothetical protein